MTKRHPITSKKRAHALSTAFFLGALAMILFVESWFWPGILLAIGLPFALRHFLLGQTYDMLMSIFIFGGAFATVYFDVSWDGFLPAILLVGSIYILFREFFGPDDTTEDEREEELNREMEENR